MYGIHEYIQACHYRRNFLSSQRDWLLQERQQFDEEARKLEGVLERIRQELVGYLIPEVHDDYVDQLHRRLSCPRLLTVKKEYDSRFDEIEKRRIELAGMNEIEFHDFQLDRANEAVEEVRPAYEEFRGKLDVWEKSKWFWRLDRRGYFGLDYSAGFFRRFFDWRAVSFLMSHLARRGNLLFGTPDELRTHYRALRSEADDVFDAYNKRTGERDRILGLKQEYDEVLRAPERLLSDLFRDLGRAVLEHLQACPEALRLEIARDDRHLNVFFKKEAGVQKQIQYLRELAVTRLESRIQQVDQELNKLDFKLRKLEMQRRRGKRKRYSRQDIQRVRLVKADKWERRRERTRKLRGRIVDFDRYEQGSYLQGFLWWDMMTKGARGDDLFEVRDFYQRHPDWDYKTFRDPTQFDSPHDIAAMDAAVSNGALDDAAEVLASDMISADDDVFIDAT